MIEGLWARIERRLHWCGLLVHWVPMGGRLTPRLLWVSRRNRVQVARRMAGLWEQAAAEWDRADGLAEEVDGSFMVESAGGSGRIPMRSLLLYEDGMLRQSEPVNADGVVSIRPLTIALTPEGRAALEAEGCGAVVLLGAARPGRDGRAAVRLVGVSAAEGARERDGRY